MKTFDITTQIYIFKMQDMKEEILNLIVSMGEFSFKDANQSLSNTDWHLNKDFPRVYSNIVSSAVLEVINKDNPITSEELYITNMWFQQYEANDFHGWHTHGDCMYSSAYYVELPAKTQTTFMIDGKEIQIDVEEGDYVVFPSCLKHSSTENKSGSRKTVLSLNLNTVRSKY
jgi:uncharacterized protein YjlB